MKNLGTLKAIFLPETIRKFLKVNDTESVDIVIEDGQVVLKNKIQNTLNEIGEILRYKLDIKISGNPKKDLKRLRNTLSA